ncbi:MULTISPECIES: hypothetical protein [Bizionia]|uniref:Uncharacterized protein n=1 Tax=Bizionia algoritergicola TaxID=291187 RepID=A0A5D0R0Y7_9FLAO|nr:MULTISPECIES: hypothetical protein [Bizionia]OBX24226.1 hypothetical protein BAA08_00035 [Bizionia sp. APA-3]TYB75147.1 hypothetical protein ES675_03190 [Bizionia algoritergicola]
MVRIINYKERQKEDGTSFFVLELQGGIEMVQSKETGSFYATAKKTYIPSTFDEDVCAALIGTEMAGKIVKESCEPFTYTIKETGEEVTLNHRWVYAAEDVVKPKRETFMPNHNVIAKSEVFSKNGILEPTM